MVAVLQKSQPRQNCHCSESSRLLWPGIGTMERVTDPTTPPDGSTLDPQIAALLKRDPAGLIAAVIQEDSTGEVLMVGWMDDLALNKTLTTGRSTFFSRSRGEYWVKGETSGHRQWVREVRLDCDGDAVLVKVHQEGPACHTGDRTCFDGRPLPAVIAQRVADADL
jgi:phosphoribosyl-AMP cyclohydrolase